MSINLLTTNNHINQPSFKANPVKKPSTFISLATRTAVGVGKVSKGYNSFIENIIAKKVVAPIMNSKKVNQLADKLGKQKDITDHMATIGSFVTTTTYAGTTLKNKNLERKPARTLALNQILVTALSTIGAYTINGGLEKFTKNMSYRFRDANKSLPDKVLEKRFKGFGVAQKLLTFSLMYRYVAPVLVTPIASKIGKALNSNDNKGAKNVQTATKKA